MKSVCVDENSLKILRGQLLCTIQEMRGIIEDRIDLKTIVNDQVWDSTTERDTKGAWKMQIK